MLQHLENCFICLSGKSTLSNIHKAFQLGRRKNQDCQNTTAILKPYLKKSSKLPNKSYILILLESQHMKFSCCGTNCLVLPHSAPTVSMPTIFPASQASSHVYKPSDISLIPMLSELFCNFSMSHFIIYYLSL